MSWSASEWNISHGRIRRAVVELTTRAMKGWKPILFSSMVVPGPTPTPTTALVNVTMVLEHVPGAGS